MLGSFYSTWTDCKGRCFAIDFEKAFTYTDLKPGVQDYASPAWADRVVSKPNYVGWQQACPPPYPGYSPLVPQDCKPPAASTATKVTTIITPSAPEVPIEAKASFQITHQETWGTPLRVTPRPRTRLVTPETIAYSQPTPGPPLPEVGADWSVNWTFLILASLGVVAFLALDR